MIPKLFVKETSFPHFASFGLSGGSHIPLRPELVHDPSRIGIDIPSTSMDSLLQVHRRKMMRRAANRRSAQLSRARKKVFHHPI